MGGEWAKYWMRISSGVKRFFQVDMEMADRLSNGPDRFLRLIEDPRRAFLLPGVKLCQLPPYLGFDGFRSVFVVKDGFEFELFAAQGRDGIFVIEGEVSLLEDAKRRCVW